MKKRKIVSMNEGMLLSLTPSHTRGQNNYEQKKKKESYRTDQNRYRTTHRARKRRRAKRRRDRRVERGRERRVKRRRRREKKKKQTYLVSLDCISAVRCSASARITSISASVIDDSPFTHTHI